MIDNEIIKDFLDESKVLIEEMLTLLEVIEDDQSQYKRLADYGNKVDRIMGGAQSLAQILPPEHAVSMIASFASLCKAVGYKASNQARENELTEFSVALLLDATEALETLLENLNFSQADLKKLIPSAFLERLKWISGQFSTEDAASVGLGNKDSNPLEIEELLKKLGL